MSTTPHGTERGPSELKSPAQVCPFCSGTGWKPEGNGVVRCIHGTPGTEHRAPVSTIPAHEIPIGAHELRRRVDAWLRAGRGPGYTFLEQAEKSLLALLQSHLGQAAAASLDSLARALEAALGRQVTDRTLKKLVHDLRVTHGIKVGSLRGWKRQPRALGGKLTSEGPRGYFLCLTAQDVLATVGTRLHEALATLEVVDSLTDGRLGLKKMLAEARGQLKLFGRSAA